MNKMIKLPLFLGVVGCLCGGILALTNYVTKDRIAADENKRVNAAYFEHFDNYYYRQAGEVSADLAKAGVTDKQYCYTIDKAYIGTVYSVSATGYAGKSNPIKFSVSFAEGSVHHYVEISHGESSAGAKFMSWLSQDKNGDRIGNLDQGKAETGSSVSYKAVNDAVNACSADYQTYLNSVPAFTGGDK